MHRLWSFGFVASLLLVPGCATTRAADKAARHTVMRAGGLEVTIDARGWTQTMGSSLLHGSDFRLGQFSAKDGRDFSLFVDDAPTNVLDELVQRNVASYAARGSVILLERAQVAGKAAGELTFVSTGSLTGVRRRELCIETLVGRKWIELHYSATEAPDALLQARADAEAIFASLRARLEPGQPVEAALSLDISEDDLALVGSLIRCPTQPQFFFCRALVAFRDGQRPDWGTPHRGVIGAALLIPASKGADDPKLVVSEAMSYLWIEDHRVAFTPLRESSDEEKRDAMGVVDAIVAGQPIPASARIGGRQFSVTNSGTTTLAMRSLTWQLNLRDDAHGFMRDTPLGFVVLLVDGGSWVISVHPHLPQ